VSPLSDDDLTIGSGVTTTPAPIRLTAGAIVAGRYRLVALLGRGGMGEVYRADDLTLDQSVALKFLPAGIAVDAAHLAQFHNELRTARQVSHKNVCRLYDLGEADGRRFLTMEYIDGEDLASLLRRIGRFPEDRAVAIARQLCAGVAAAHDRGVVHRDLKPANVMIDGDGNVRITDFGIATAAAAADGGSAVVGTPQYMSPEQLAGGAASTRTDIYALGLVLFEIFTGRRAHEAKTLNDLKALHDTGTITTPTSIVQGLDPAIERVILRCLDRDPTRRPVSALAVAAGLPGADPLAAALAAGETPSPEMLVAAAETEALPVRWGLAAVALVVACVVTVALLAPRLSIVGRMPLDRPPAVLTDRAQQILTSLGYRGPYTDSASSFTIASDYLQWIETKDKGPDRWRTLTVGSPPTVVFWHRTSPRLLVPTRITPSVTTADPPHTISGMTYLLLDTQGRLVEFHTVPPQVDPSDAPAEPPHWDALFTAAGLDFSAFTPTTPKWTPRDFADVRAAWEGPLVDHPEYRVRLEAAGYRGRPVSMLIVGPWSRPTRMEAAPRTTAQSILATFIAAIIVVLVVAAVLLARHNLRAKRADARGAARLALFIMCGYAVTWALSAHHVADINVEIGTFARHFGSTLLAAGLLWLIYMALEPYVRRFWPDGILGWTRLLSGYVRDPRVGRDVLVGCVFAAIICFDQMLFHIVPPLLGAPAPFPYFHTFVGALTDLPTAIATMFDTAIGGLFAAMFVVLGYVLLRLVFRRTDVAIAAAVVVIAIVQGQQVLASGTTLWLSLLFQATVIVLIMTVVVRHGLLATAVAASVGNILVGLPMTASLSHWTATTSNLVLVTVVGVACFGFYASRAGQLLFGNLQV
jgi:serine/threonine-protein kinase